MAAAILLPAGFGASPMQKGFSLPKLTVLRRSAETPRETRYLLHSAGAAIAEAEVVFGGTALVAMTSMVALIDGWPFKKSAV